MNARTKTCPICKNRDAVADYRPFCSKRCADVDLSRWLGGKYAIPAVEQPDEYELAALMDEAEHDEQGGSS